jgi:hypothetical protein
MDPIRPLCECVTDKTMQKVQWNRWYFPTIMLALSAVTALCVAYVVFRVTKSELRPPCTPA